MQEHPTVGMHPVMGGIVSLDSMPTDLYQELLDVISHWRQINRRCGLFGAASDAERLMRRLREHAVYHPAPTRPFPAAPSTTVTWRPGV